MTKPYYAVIFTSTRTSGDKGYLQMAKQMEELAKNQPGYLGFESAKDKIGISISYWKNLESISKWKSNLKHLAAQEMGKKEWYKWYKIRVCLVEREYEFTASS
ncbi:antibiotic biosynthesis monooxygenase [uncultured Eudoraea sp.]|uniref:antibiotic biosynthesis monooxygenase family protein n=1 Tax=uncultured Eudoraea sp. TaxID=1035614 RepID=UPI002606B3F4|nr:antibiotic biosynthesis monooxygenase [uncultured Eudoraea sp.]